MPDTWFFNWGLPVLVVLLWCAATGLLAWLLISVATRGVATRRPAEPVEHRELVDRPGYCKDLTCDRPGHAEWNLWIGDGATRRPE